MSRRKKKVPRVRLALFGILIICVGVYFVFAKRIPFVHGYRLKADFASSNQLVPGFSPVRIAGVTVGKVIKVQAGPGDTSEVTMDIKNAALPIHSDARVRIRPRLFLEGGFFVELNPGSPSAKDIGSDSVLPVDQTADPVQLHQILTAFDVTTRDSLSSLLKEADDAFSHGGAKAFGESFRPLSPVLEEGAQIAEAALGPVAHDPSNGIRATAKLTQVFADHQQNLKGLITSLNRTTTALASRDVQLQQSIRSIDTLVRTAPGQLDRINATLPAINRFVIAIRPTLRALPPVLDHTVPVLDQLRALVQPAELPGLLTDLTPVARDLDPLTDRLDRLFPLITPVTDCVTRKVFPILNQTVPDGALSTGRPAWQDLAHAFVGLSSAAQNFDGNGYAFRFQAGVGETSIGTGSVPGLGTLAGLAAAPLSGSTPRWLGPGVIPPLNASQQCRKQATVDLTQRTAQGPLETARTAAAPKHAAKDVQELDQQLKSYNRGIRSLVGDTP
jgi:virulence factor Mce-like protein